MMKRRCRNQAEFLGPQVRPLNSVCRHGPSPPKSSVLKITNIDSKPQATDPRETDSAHRVFLIRQEFLKFKGLPQL